MRIPTAKRAVRAGLACVCLAVLLAAGWAQAGHVCGALQAAPGAPGGVGGPGASSGICPICALAQPARPGAMPAMLAPVAAVTAACILSQPQLHSFHPLFALKVRPPPA